MIMALLVWVVNIDRQEPQNGQTDDDLIKFKLFFLTTTNPGKRTALTGRW